MGATGVVRDHPPGDLSRGAGSVARPPADPADSAHRLRPIPALDGVRGLAVAAVVMFHYPTRAWVKGGLFGVDVFFVLSGFLVTAGLLDEVLDSGSIRVRAFFARRARRLVPALIVKYLGAETVTAVAAAAVVAFLVTCPADAPASHALGVAPLTWLGRRSYGVYLWHWPLAEWTNRIPHQIGVPLGIGLSLLLAEASWRLVERPAQRRPPGPLGAPASRTGERDADPSVDKRRLTRP
jgi:peptidoglycan/LPS O-acetylase OafA/YrhL